MRIAWARAASQGSGLSVGLSTTLSPAGSEGPESNQSFGVSDTANCMDMRVDELADIHVILQVQFHEQIE